MPVLVVPVGSTEQHGPHLPLSTDTDIAVALAERGGRRARRRGGRAGGAVRVQRRARRLPRHAVDRGGGDRAAAGRARSRCAGDVRRRACCCRAHGGNAEPVARAARAAARARGGGCMRGRRDGRGRARRPHRDVADARARPGAASRRAGRVGGDTRRSTSCCRGCGPAASRPVSPTGSSATRPARTAAEGRAAARARRRPSSTPSRRRDSTGAGARVSERVAVVTGAARGIGAATVAGAGGGGLVRSSRSTDAPTTRGCRTGSGPGRSSRRWSRAPAAALRPPLIADARDQAAWRARSALAEASFGGLDAVDRRRRRDRRRACRCGRCRPPSSRRRCSTSTCASVLVAARVGDPGAAAPARAARRALPRGRLGGRDARAADAGRVLRGEGGRHRPRPGAGRGAPRHRGDRQRGQPRARPRRRSSTRARGCTAWSRPRRSPRSSRSRG